MSFKLSRLISPVAAIAVTAACAQNYQSAPYGYAPTQTAYESEAPQAYADANGQPYVQQAQGTLYQPVPQGQKIRFKAQDIKFISSYNAPGRAPNVDHRLLVYPEQIVHKWAVNRFGIDKTPDRHVRFMIKDASIVEENIVTGGSMNKQIQQQYTGKIDVTIQVVNSEGALIVETSASVMRRRIIDREASLEDHENLWIILTFDLIKALSSRLDQDLSAPSFNDVIER